MSEQEAFCGGHRPEGAKARQVPAAQLLLSDKAGSQAQCQLFESSPLITLITFASLEPWAD